jgi:hypothetical protein
MEQDSHDGSVGQLQAAEHGSSGGEGAQFIVADAHQVIEPELLTLLDESTASEAAVGDDQPPPHRLRLFSSRPAGPKLYKIKSGDESGRRSLAGREGACIIRP